MVAVAQLVESRIVIPVVVGSSPIIHPSLVRIRGCISFSRLREKVPKADEGRLRQRALTPCPLPQAGEGE